VKSRPCEWLKKLCHWVTEKMKHAEKKATSGGRSRDYFGILAEFSGEWFNDTSHGCGVSTYHPTIIPLRKFEREQSDLKRVMISSWHAAGSRKEEALQAWRGIVSRATRSISEKFAAINGRNGPVERTKENESLVLFLGHGAIAEIRESVCKAIKTPPQQPSLFDAFGAREFVYLRRFQHRVDGLLKIKIGDTDNCESRGGSYESHTGGELEVVWASKCFPGLSEDEMRDALRSADKTITVAGKKDWFLVDDKTFEKINTPPGMAAFIRQQKNRPADFLKRAKDEANQPF